MREEEKAIWCRRPTRQGIGCCPRRAGGKGDMRLRSKEYMRMAHPSRPREAKASRVLSGEMRGRERDGAQVRDLVLVLAVVIHGPDFL